MTITLLTAVPRTGKTSYAVWDIIKPAIEEGKTVYVCGIPKLQLPHIKVCLLYTSDAADERSSVDLGGRRIIKKKL